MIREGQVVLFHFPYSNLSSGKIRPAIVLRGLPGQYDDWLICMISSQLSQQIIGIEEIINKDDDDYGSSGLKVPSLIRIFRVAVVEKNSLKGVIGEISPERLKRIKTSIAEWIVG